MDHVFELFPHTCRITGAVLSVKGSAVLPGIKPRWRNTEFYIFSFGLCRNCSESFVCIAGNKLDSFPVDAGLCQGCPLSLILFIILWTAFLRATQRPLCCLWMMWFCWFHQALASSLHWSSLQASENKNLEREFAPPSQRLWFSTQKWWSARSGPGMSCCPKWRSLSYLGVLWGKRGARAWQMD